MVVRVSKIGAIAEATPAHISGMHLFPTREGAEARLAELLDLET